MTAGDIRRDLIGSGGSASLVFWDGIPGGVVGVTPGITSVSAEPALRASRFLLSTSAFGAALSLGHKDEYVENVFSHSLHVSGLGSAYGRLRK